MSPAWQVDSLPLSHLGSPDQSICCSVVQFCLTLCNPMGCSRPGSLSFTISQSLLKLMSIESVTPSNHFILCRPLLLLPSTFSSINIFFNKSALCIKWLKRSSFNFGISPSNEYSGLISFRMGWLDLLAVQGTLKRLLQQQFKSINSLVLSFVYCPTLTSIHPNMTTGKTTDLTIWIFVSKVILCFLICCLGWPQLFFQRASIFNFMAAVIIHSDFGVQGKKICHCFHVFPLYLP